MFLRKQKSKRDTYKIQQAISKAINTTGPSVVTFWIYPQPSHPDLPSSPPNLPDSAPKVNNKEKRQRSGRMHI